MLVMKTLFIVLTYLVFCDNVYPQYDQHVTYSQLYSGTEVSKGIYSVNGGEKGITFVNQSGKQYSGYFKALDNDYTLRCGLFIYKTGRAEESLPQHLKKEIYTVVPLVLIVKELQNIDETYLDDFAAKASAEYRYAPEAFTDKFIFDIPLCGYARIGDKYAYITKFGELVTEFIYNKDQFGLYRIDAIGNKLYYNPHTYKEEKYETTLALSHSLGRGFFEVYDDDGKYFLQYQGYVYPFDSGSPLRNAVDRGLPVECNVLSDGRTIYQLVNGKVKQIKLKDCVVRTNFYKNRAIAAIKDNKTGSERLVVINERGKIVTSRSLNATLDDLMFDRFGLITVSSDQGQAVIDYTGKIVIPFCRDCTVTFMADGLYGVFYKRDSINLDLEKSGIYNQYGVKIIDAENSYYTPKLKLAEGLDYNYLMFGLSVYHKLDKNNNRVK